MRIMGFWTAIAQTIYGDSTRPIRLVLAMVEILFATYLMAHWETQQFESMRAFAELATWEVLLVVHAIYLIKGLTGRYSSVSWIMEGWLGMTMWWIVAITNWTSQGVPGPTLACALAMTIIWVNYPGNRPTPFKDEDDLNG